MTEHRAGAVRDDMTYWAVCSCGWKRSFHSLLAARREAREHRRYPDGNPRVAALSDTDARPAGEAERCPECDGHGHGPDRAYGPDVWQDPCETCGGSGVAPSSEATR